MRNSVLGQRYRILDRLGEGGMANVYRALDEKLGRYVAIKILHDHLRRNPDIRSRFQQEAQAVSTLDHPNIMRIYDFSGPDLEQLWLVAEIINGTTLASMQQAWPNRHLPEIIAACIVREIARALEHAHRSGIVHRDIKPENVMVTADGRLKLMDFGIAKDTQKHKKTVTGMFMGSPSYMSQEQVKGRNVDGRSDIYSLGVLFYELLTGRLPFEGASSADVVEKISKGEFVFPRFRTHGLSLEIDRMVVRCMQKNPESRFQSVAELGIAIDVWLTSQKVFSSAMELESHILRGSTQPPQAISNSAEQEALPDREPATPFTQRAESSRKTKVRTAQPRLIRPAEKHEPKAKTPPRNQKHGMRPQVRPVQIRQTFIRDSGSQAPVLISIAVAVFMAFLWLTDFRILKIIKNSTQSQTSTVVQTRPQTKPEPAPVAPTINPVVQPVSSPPALNQPTLRQNASPASPVAPVKPAKKEPRKVNRDRSPGRPESTTITVAPTMAPPSPTSQLPTSPSISPPVSPAVPAQAAPGNARLSITSQPAAEIFINNRRIGTTLDSANGEGSGWFPVTSGPLTISLRRNGYRDYVKKISVAKGDRITLGSITLERAESKSQAAGENRAIPTRTLTISSNRWPANVSITPTPDTNGPSQKFRMEQSSRSIKLPAGRYTIRVECDGDIKERRIDTSISSTGITYNVEFSRPQSTVGSPKSGGREP